MNVPKMVIPDSCMSLCPLVYQIDMLARLLTQEVVVIDPIIFKIGHGVCSC